MLLPSSRDHIAVHPIHLKSFSPLGRRPLQKSPFSLARIIPAVLYGFCRVLRIWEHPEIFSWGDRGSIRHSIVKGWTWVCLCVDQYPLFAGEAMAREEAEICSNRLDTSLRGAYR